MELKKTLKKIIKLGRHTYYEEGIQFYNQGRFPEALEKFKKITLHGQEETSLHYNLASFYSGLIHRNLGLLFLHQGDYPEAIAHYNMALEFNPTHYEIYNYLGIAYNNWRRYSKAMAAFAMVLELAPELLSLRYKVAIVLYNLKKYDEALEAIKNLILINPQFADFHYHLGVVCGHRRQFEEAQKAFSQALALNPNYLQAKVQLSLVLAAQGLYDQAILTLAEIIEEKPEYPDIYYNMGVIQGAQKDWKGALASVKKALAINPNYANAHFILGILYFRNNEVALAEEEIHEALALNLEDVKQSFAENILAYLEKRKTGINGEENGSSQSQINPLKEEYLEKMLQVFPHHLAIMPDYIEILEKFGAKWDRPLLDTLVQLYEEEINKNPSYADLYYQLGKVYQQMEAWDKAIMIFSRALEINPRFFKARIHLYQLFLKVEMLEEAKIELEFLIEEGFQFPDICLDLATIYIKEERWDGALNCLNKAITGNPEFEKAFLLAALVHEKKGNIDQAIDQLSGFKAKCGTGSKEIDIKLRELEEKRIGGGR